MKFIPFFSIILFSFLVSFSCVKPKPPIEFDLSKEIKDLWDFKPGTYWIYQDSISGEQDSVFVFNYEHKYIYYGPSRNHTRKNAGFEYILYQFNLFNDSIVLGIGFYDVLFNPPLEDVGSDIFPQGRLLIFDFSLMNVGITNLGYPIDLTEVLPSSELKKYIVKPNIGITRYEFKDGKVYKLIRQHIIQ